MDELIEELREDSFNKNVEIDKERWEKYQEDLHLTNLSLAEFLNKNKPSYRDNRKLTSIHLKDYRNYEHSDKDFVVELERFNPEHHPLLHLLTDFPLYLWKNIFR